MLERKLSNLYIEKKAGNVDYKPISTPGSKPNFPRRESRDNHASYLQTQFNSAWELAVKQAEEVNVVSASTRNGVYLEIKGKEGYDLLTKSLENITQHVRLCNIKKDDEGVISSTVFIPNNKKDFFLKKINKYKDTQNEEKGTASQLSQSNYIATGRILHTVFGHKA
ncbi:MAG: hypothetical protein NUK65_11290 [Firmicutes bacterium]|nr:hypothetical protein [Bacillota bacterium]